MVCLSNFSHPHQRSAVSVAISTVLKPMQSDAVEQATGGSRFENLREKIAAVRERRDRYQEMLAELERTGEDQISLTDPDSRAMAAHTHVAVGYNVQIAVGLDARATNLARYRG